MRGNFATLTVEEICEKIIDYRGKTPQKTDSGVRLITAKVIKSGRIDDSSFEYIAEDEYDSWMRRGLPQAGDVLVTTEAPLGEVTAVPADDRIALAQRVILLRANPVICHPTYLLYAFQSSYVQGELSSRASGCTVTGIKNSELRNVKVPLPTIGEQKQIGSILSTYDDLIENNRRRMALLEDAARQVYQEWFVRLRFPGYEHTRIVDGVPEGWEKKSLHELTSFLKRGITPTYDDDAEGLVINQKCIRDGRVNMDLARRQSKDVKAERIVQLGDVLINSTGEGTLGRVAQIKTALTNCTVDTHVTIVRPNEGIPKHYFGMAIMEWEPRFSTMGKGATNQTELSPAAIGETIIQLPSHTLLEQFESLAEPLYAQVTNLTEQNQKLRTARDLLLPKLMSGEIAV